MRYSLLVATPLAISILCLYVKPTHAFSLLPNNAAVRVSPFQKKFWDNRAHFVQLKANVNSSEIARQELHSYRSHLDLSRQAGSGHATREVVMKFGGSSLATSECIDHIAHLIKDQIQNGYQPRAIVCSAMGKTTNGLLNAGSMALDGHVDLDAVRTLHLDAIHHFNMSDNTLREVTELLDECSKMLKGVSLIQELSPKALDQLVSYGERCSVRIVAARLNQLGIPALALDAWDAGICTNSEFGDAKLLPECDEQIRSKFDRIDKNIVAVVTGFIGHDKNKKVTTLGRSGSDLSATQIGAALGVDEILFWKDVDGILSTDPRIVPSAVPISDVTYDEASELAYFGAQVLHPIAMQPARKYNVPCRVKNSYNPNAEGTIIRNEKTHDRLVSAITFKRDIKLLDFHAKNLVSYGFLSKIFRSFEKHKISVDVLASSEVSVSLTLDKKQDENQIMLIKEDLQETCEIQLKDNKAILTLITDVSRSSEVLATVFRVFMEQGIKVEMMSQGSSKVNISFIVEGTDLDQAVRSLHQCFFEDSCADPRLELDNGDMLDLKDDRQKLEDLLKIEAMNVTAINNLLILQ